MKCFKCDQCCVDLFDVPCYFFGDVPTKCPVDNLAAEWVPTDKVHFIRGIDA